MIERTGTKFHDSLYERLTKKGRVVLNPKVHPEKPRVGFSAHTELFRAKNYLSRIQSLNPPTTFTESPIPNGIHANKTLCNREIPFAFLSEVLIECALEKIMLKHGLSIHLAPSSLENAYFSQYSEHPIIIKEEGIDLLIGKDYEGLHIPYLAINAKLGKHNRDLHRIVYQRRVNIPFIELKLGDWNIATRESDHVAIRGWIYNYVLPHIESQTSIPYFEEFKTFVCVTLYETLLQYYNEINSSDCIGSNYPDSRVLKVPVTQDELFAMKNKIEQILQVLRELV